jgi:hypothetical protein
MLSRPFLGRGLLAFLLLGLSAGCSEDELPAADSTTNPGVARFLISPDDENIAQSPDLQELLSASPYAFFRFHNRAWAKAVCEELHDDLGEMPMLNLHGDAHVEQYAVTADDQGLDDFDDASSGPPVLDLVRFVSSVHLACRRHGWEAETERIVDGFFDGYRAGIADLELDPEVPACIARIRQRKTPSATEFLAWAESLMHPLEPEDRKALEADTKRFAEMMRKKRSDLPSGFFDVKSAGWLRMGVGSRGDPKILVRIDGPSSEPDDDLIIEGKQLRDLSSIDCIQMPAGVLRVLMGVRRVGRLNHEILGHVPDARTEGPLWWIKSWEPSYQELTLDDLQSPDELREIAYDSGVQLGQGHVRGPKGSEGGPGRRAAVEVAEWYESKVRELSSRLVADMLEAWEIFRADVGR